MVGGFALLFLFLPNSRVARFFLQLGITFGRLGCTYWYTPCVKNVINVLYDYAVPSFGVSVYTNATTTGLLNSFWYQFYCEG